jgi:hypothetical protein
MARAAVLIIAFFLLVFTPLTGHAEGPAGPDSITGFDEFRPGEGPGIGYYDVIFMESPDTSGLDIVSKLGYESDFEPGDEDEAKDLSYKTYKIFSEKLSEVIEVSIDKNELEGRKAAVLSLGLTGEIKEYGLLTSFFSESDNRLYFECALLDYETQDVIFSASDSYTMSYRTEEDFLIKGNYMPEVIGRLEFWADSLSEYIKGQIYGRSER